MLKNKLYPVNISRRQILLVLSLTIIPLAASVLGSETITLKTYYPSPYGSYQKMKITKLLTAGSSTDALLIDGRVVIGSGNTTLPLNYGNAKKTENVQVDVNGSQAVNDLWLKSVGKWASDPSVLAIETALAFRYRSNPIVTVKGPANAFFPTYALPPAGTYYASYGKMYGIECDSTKGWIRTGCSEMLDGGDLDFSLTMNGCLSEDLDDSVAEIALSCIRYLVNGTPIIPN
ncbi:MAG: hypothetical protein WCS77_08280 [Elusimicrobiaceae bacterium]|jgi:hypothetical protein